MHTWCVFRTNLRDTNRSIAQFAICSTKHMISTPVRLAEPMGASEAEYTAEKYRVATARSCHTSVAGSRYRRRVRRTHVMLLLCANLDMQLACVFCFVLRKIHNLKS